MARSDLLTTLVRAGAEGDNALFRQTVEALVVDERSKQHHVLAERLESYLGRHPEESGTISASDGKEFHLFAQVMPRRKMGDLLLPDVVVRTCGELVEEQHRVELLRSNNLEPRNRILLAGPPGNGKTSLAEALATELLVPLFVVRYEGVIASYLGETAVRLARLFEAVRSRRCVLFFDEFDAIGKERGDLHETGEIKRVVSSLLLQVDALPSHVVVIVASNHPELLDRAVWRRFQLRLSLPPPSVPDISRFIERFLGRSRPRLELAVGEAAKRLRQASFAEVQEVCEDILRRHLLGGPAAITRNIVEDRLRQWEQRVRPPNVR